MSNEPNQVYQRVDLSHVSAAAPGDASSDTPTAPNDASPAEAQGRCGVRWSIIPLSVLLCVIQSAVTVIAMNTRDVLLVATLMSVLSFVVLFALVLVVNPLLRAVFREKILKPFNRAELMCVFSALLVTGGIATFGLASQLVPLIATPWNPEWNTAQRGWQEEVLPHLNEALYLTVPAEGEATAEERQAAVDVLRVYRQGVQPVDEAGRTILPPADNAPLGEKMGYWWQVAQAVPWSAWMGPLLGWLIFIGACYAMFYSLTYVVLDFWVRREKLIFPLAQIPEQLMPDPAERNWLPWTLRQGGFWGMFALSFLVLSWNGGVAAEWIPGMGPIPLGMGGGTLSNMLRETVFAGMLGGRFGLTFMFIFTAIGVAFLLPTQVSFSLWFYYLVGKVMILLLIWFGYGSGAGDFPTNWLSATNTVTSQGGGALLVFSAIILGRSLIEYVQLARGKSAAEQFKIGVPVIGLAISLTIICGWLYWNNLPMWWAILVTIFLALLTMGLMRVVAEGGVYWFQIHLTPFHLYNVFGLGSILKASAVLPLMPIYSTLFLDVKTFLAPNLTNAAKMQEDVGTDRRKFHLNMVLCLVVSVGVAIGMSLFIAHLIGAQQMSRWFYTMAVPSLLDTAQSLVSNEPEKDPGNIISYFLGGVWVVISMVVRRTLFWFPHPIGYVMMLNPLMAKMWLSFFIGWLAKRLVVQYGGKSTFDRTRPIFIGLIMGELVAIVLWTMLGLSYDFSAGLSLNR